MTEQYEPELGQALFGCSWQQYELPTELEFAIEAIGYLLRVLFDCDPASNTGDRWSCPVFSIRAYYWGDDEAEAAIPNFQYDDIQVCWYKHLRRGATVNRNVGTVECQRLLADCASAIIKAYHEQA